jgi:hypothetical protein
MFCPSIGQGGSVPEPGAWLGIDSTDNLYMSTSSTGLSWFDTTANAHFIFRTPEFAGYGDSSAATPTFYQITGGADDTNGGFGSTRSSALYNGSQPLFHSNVSGVRARYQWGNGAILFDREGDSETVVGRYGPIKK